MSKRTGNRNGREAKKRRVRHRRRASDAWHRLNEICETCGADYPRGHMHRHAPDPFRPGYWYSWSNDFRPQPKPLFDEGVTYSNRPKEGT